ncbi:amino acid ABC transporter permease [Mesorhizobium sp. ESP7-2]|uniref:amino acid ABC transporter permease n=1 Tax=Mesorhizobium sp. ESP7-2 TaxID=2876622 RepID=UPI001CCCE90E|nr:amino acid ABC transporter permease [Mesorhizobium sp. ESP7-2]MBZ9709497.1 amino acid ABC transporter permease [Mesorhizobium sp. ESP7-2]
MTATYKSQDGASVDADVVVPARYPGRWVAVAASLIVAIFFFISLATNPAYQWDVVWHYLFSGVVLKGFLWTIGLTVVAMTIGSLLGLVIALMRQSTNPVLAVFAAAFIWIFRGTPLLVQLIFWYNLAALYPTIEIGIPFLPPFASYSTNDLITPLAAAILGLGLNEAAYMAEIVRSGLLSVDPGQREAASSLGLTPATTIRRIILPQALRVIVPPAGNEVIGMLKATSLVSVLAIADLLYSVQGIYGRTFETIPLLIVASIWYLVASTTLTFFQRICERRLGRGHSVSRLDGLSILLAPIKDMFVSRPLSRLG